MGYRIALTECAVWAKQMMDGWHILCRIACGGYVMFDVNAQTREECEASLAEIKQRGWIDGMRMRCD